MFWKRILLINRQIKPFNFCRLGCINPILANVPISYPLKSPENQKWVTVLLKYMKPAPVFLFILQLRQVFTRYHQFVLLRYLPICPRRISRRLAFLLISFRFCVVLFYIMEIMIKRNCSTIKLWKKAHRLMLFKSFCGLVFRCKGQFFLLVV